VIAGAVLTVAENTVRGSVLGTLAASDGDGDSLVYSLTTPTPAFALDPVTGELAVMGSLDYETTTTYTLTVSVTDPAGATAAAEVSILVGDVDEPPTGASAAFPVVENLAIGSTVGAVAGSDPEGAPVTFSLVGGDPTGRFTIDPSTGEIMLAGALDAGTMPSYLLEVVMADPAGNTAPVAVIVIVNPAALLPPINAAPLGVSDLFTLDEDTRAIVAPLANDRDPDGDVLFLTWVGRPAHGTLVANGDGTFTYTPNSDFHGTESINYGLSDGRGGVSNSTMVLSIRPVNDAPVTTNVETLLDFSRELFIPIPNGTFDPDGDPVHIGLGRLGKGTATLVPGGFLYTPPPEWNGIDVFTYEASDGNGGLSIGFVTVTVRQLDGDLVAIDLVSVEPVTAPNRPTSNIFVDSIRLLVGTVSEMAGLLGIPLLAVGVAFLASVMLGFSRNFLIGRGPVFLPATNPGTVAIVRVPDGGVVTALEGPGEEFPLVHRYRPAETGIRSTGRRAQRGATVWVEVETPDGDAWIIDRLVTQMVPGGSFASDKSVSELLAGMVEAISRRADITELVSSHGLLVAYYASPKLIIDDELESLLGGNASWGWWDPTGSSPSVRGEFSAMVAAPLAEAITTIEGRAVAEAVVDIPVELVNFPSLTFSRPDRLGWRVFITYEDDGPRLAAIWREGVSNPAST
jgi:hypothetical protein